MIVSLVGRTTSGSVSSRGGRGTQLAVGVDLQPVVRDDGAFLGKALDVRGLLFEVATAG